MIGFEIIHDGNKIIVAVNDGLLTIHLFDNKGDCRIYTDAIDYEFSQRSIWHNWKKISLGDDFLMKFVEIDEPSIPFCKEDIEVVKPITKMEIFRTLEAKLKKEGLI